MSATSLSDSTAVGNAGMSLDGIAQLALEAVERQRGVGEDRRRAVIGAALPRAAVAGEAAVGEEEPLAVGGIAVRGVLRRARCDDRTESGRSQRPRYA